MIRTATLTGPRAQPPGASANWRSDLSERVIRLGSPNVAATVHVAPDSRYILLPVMANPSAVRGWVVYDTIKGTVVHDELLDLHAAREWAST